MKRLAFLIIFIATQLQAVADLKKIEQTKQTHKLSESLATLEYRLPNGLTVFLTENPKSPNVVVSHWVKAGSLHETPGITGIAHLFEHMMFRPLSANEPSFFEIATQLGGDLNANTRFESTYYYTAVPPQNLKKILKRESDRFQKLVVTKELLDVERKAVWSEYSMKFDANPMIDLWFHIYQQGFKSHPFGWTIIGFREDLDKITAEDCNSFFQKYYKPNNIGLFITGNFKAKDALKEVVAHYSNWKPGVQSELPSPFNQKTKEIIAEGKLPSDANFVLFGFRTPYFGKDNVKIQTVANYILFDENDGLLKKKLVDEKKMAAEVSEFNFDYDNGMQKVGIVSLPNTKIGQVRVEILSMRKAFDSLSDKDFETYKRNLYIRKGESVQRNLDLADHLALSWGKYGSLQLSAEFTGKPLDVTKEQVQQFLSQYFVPENFIFMAHKGQGK